MSCAAGYYAGFNMCVICALGSYSIEPVNKCTACDAGKWTLTEGSSDADDCIQFGNAEEIYADDCIQFGNAEEIFSIF